MENYNRLWLWMIIPMVAMQAGIFMDYWGDFSSNTFAVHVHYWNATAWYAFLISQPWLFAEGRIERHRLWGMIGLMLAGAMVLLSMSQLFRDIIYANSVRDVPEQWGPFEPWFFFWIMITEIMLIIAFAAAVIMAIVKRKSLPDHAWWMASTAFIIIMPAIGRGFQNVWLIVYGFGVENKAALTVPILLCQTVIIALMLLFAWRFKKLKHPATIFAVIVNAAIFLFIPVAKTSAVQEFIRTVVAH